MAEIIFSFRQFLSLILILLAKLSNKNFGEFLSFFVRFHLITFFTQLLLALMFSTNDTDVSLQLCFTLPNEVRPQQTVSHSLELTNKLSHNSYKQWLHMGSPTQPSEEQLTVLIQSSNIQQSQVEPFTPCQVSISVTICPLGYCMGSLHLSQ